MAMIETDRFTLVGWALGLGERSGAIAAVTRKTVLDRIVAVLMLAAFLGVAAYTLVRPDYNWDMLAYVATALEDRHADPVDLHAETWALVSEGAREGQLYNLQQGNPYNLHQWQNPADFQSQLSMYRVKIGYVELLRLMEPVIGLVNASIWLNILPSIGFGLFCIWWLARENALQAGLFVVPFLLLADYTHMTSAVTPDMLLALMSLVAIYLLWRGRDLAACLLLFASVFIRPDNVILIFALLIAAVIYGWRVMPMLVTFAASLAATILVQHYGEHPGWWAHFYFSCVRIQHSMIGFAPDFSLVDFARGYARGVAVSLLDNDWPALLVMLTAAWALLARLGRIGAGRENALIFALAIGTLGKFASFPLPDDRFYFVFLGAMAMLIAIVWKPRFDAARG